jgi:hypothetical protein
VSTRNFRFWIILKYIFYDGVWLTTAQWDFASRLLKPLSVPRSFLERNRNPTQAERASEESLLRTVVLAWCLKNTPPGGIPDKDVRQSLLDYLLYAEGYDIPYYRGKYFAISNLYSSLLSKVQYSGKWSRRGSPSNRVRSASAVSSGNSLHVSPWRLTPKRILLPEHGGVKERDSVVLDPFYLLGTVESSITDLRLLKLNNGAFF